MFLGRKKNSAGAFSSPPCTQVKPMSQGMSQESGTILSLQDMLKQKTATDATWKGPKNLNSHNTSLNAITHFTTRTPVLTKSVIHNDDYFAMIFTVILCHPVSWCQTVNTQHYTSLL
jgi:hypothetical protein